MFNNFYSLKLALFTKQFYLISLPIDEEKLKKGHSNHITAFFLI